MTQKKKENNTTLRNRAETLLGEHSEVTDTPRPEDFRQLVHDLHVHQIELELQNEELRQAQTRLEENRARYLNLYHNAPVGYVILNPTGIIKESNTTFAKMVGRESPLIHGKPFADFLDTGDQAIFRARLRSFFKQPIDKHIELRIKTGKESIRYVDFSAAMQNDHDTLKEKHAELLVTITDTTARREAEEALRKSHNYIVAIIDSLDSHLCVIDENGIILMTNEAWKKFAAENSAHTDNLAEGANYLTVCDNAKGDEAESGHLFASGIRAILKNERKTFRLEYPCHAPDQQRWFIGMATKLIDDNVNGKIVVAHQNISERKQLEKEQLYLHDQMKQVEKAESLGLMAGAIAHNFNNMLGAIVGNLELALEVQDTEHNTQKIKNALSAAWRASELSSLMLTYLGQMITDTELVDFSSACNQDFHLLNLAKPNKITITTDFQSPGPHVRVNNKQMRQIVSNLVTNAWESMGDKPGNIHLTICTVRSREIASKLRFPIDWQPQEQRYACLTVQDDGCGISAKDIGNIFDPFFTSKFTGRGMGLSVILGILRSYEGAITVESQIDDGSVFKVYIPVSSP